MPKNAFIPVALIVIGLAWLLDELHIFPEVSWLWIIGLISGGVAVLLLDGITKSSVVAGPMLIGAGISTFIRQNYGLSLHVQLPMLMILLGVLLLISRSPKIPESSRKLTGKE